MWNNLIEKTTGCFPIFAVAMLLLFFLMCGCAAIMHFTLHLI